MLCRESLKTIRPPKRTAEQRQNDNIENGKPRNAGLPWTTELRAEAAAKFKKGSSVNELAESFERTPGAITSELIKQGFIDAGVVSYIKWRLRAPQKFQVKAQPAVNGHPLNKGCNAGLKLLWGSLWARREGIICCVAPLGKDPAIPCETRLAANTFSSRLIVT